MNSEDTEDNAEWQLADLVDAMSAEVDRAEDTLALKSYSRKISLAIKSVALDVEVTMRRTEDGLVYFRSVPPGTETRTLLKLDFAQVLESQLAGLRRPLDDTTTSAPLSTLPGITPAEIRALNSIAVYSVDDLLRYTRTTSMLAEVSRITGLAETRLRAWRGDPYVLEVKPALGLPGGSVVIEGGNFGLVKPANALVMFHGKEATILQWSSTRLTVAVPADISGAGLVFVVLGARPTNVVSWVASVMDLRVEGLEMEPVAGEPFALEAVLFNRGAGASPVFSVQWSVDGVPEPLQVHGVLLPGQRSAESVCRRELALGVGTHTVQLLVDPEGKLPVADRAGLSFSRTFEVHALKTLVLGSFHPLSTLDPLRAGPQGSSSVLGLLFRGLGRRDGVKKQWVPELAESWTAPVPVQVNGASLYAVTVTLRADLRFHDGTALRGEDVRYTFQKLKEEGSPWRELALRVRDVTPQGQTLTFLLEAPEALEPLMTVGIVPQGAHAKDPVGFGQRPLGTGPFRVRSFSGETLELQAFGRYFRGAPRVDRLRVVTVPDLDRLGERVEQQEFQATVMPYDEGWYQRLMDLGEWRLTPDLSASPPVLHVQVPSLREREVLAPDSTAGAHLWYLLD
ncbi:ABC transporter substrate-binding protein [Stigmatella sp. ncwal1]|uniref:ABC transporter substrate-binding protein n=1 Tax=Stigmatella ashevillensis TaxID=2995309 RepID=A0ABT5DAR2_9BACT|nr:ABC transporter substrate-binding protein [Stigmatella ashevillena]MDC0710752.1 ABC transporter substrate-binding protein [Stigmatella ashevillena]